MTPIICANKVSKRFTANEDRPSLRQNASAMVRQWCGLPSNRPEPTPFWALYDVSFTIERGETVAIIGRNGAGKTTLLRLLADITEPTTGTVAVNGRYAALLGLGAGFDDERTGRENIYLNAAIYGLAPREVDAIMDDIIAFAELDDFIDRPIKRYSSGMRSRLGFSVALHVLPDVMMLDEVLAVGDTAFQAKCLERMLQMKEEGRTILFVSHSSGSIRQLCERAIWLHEGQLIADDTATDVLKAYEQRFGASSDE
jgi:lipopolysaccharide transport system ATP-binding protein